jgi:vacuolar-type H+-ATPase subunit F/Vma7
VTIKNLFKLIGGGIVAFLFAILGIQRKKIAKQKEVIKEQKEEVKQAEQKAATAHEAVKVVVTHKKAEDAIQTQETTNAGKIEEADNEEELVNLGNALIDSFNKSSRL